MNAVARLLGVALLAGLLAVPSPLGACAVAPPRDVVVEIASESAIIVWDREAKTEHFIRRATFAPTAPGSTPVKDFGFLVPTPSVPALEEVDDRAFAELAKVTAPRTETRSRPAGGGCALGCGALAPKADAPPAAVEVLAEKHVAGYDAQVLRAGDADALTAWLKGHDYEVRPALAQWLKPYLEKKWVVTAFKIGNAPAAQPNSPVGSAAVRMSFRTDAPFYPYREPADMRDAKAPRLLRVFVIADQKMNGSLGAGAPWAGQTVWAGAPGAEGWKGALAHLKVPGLRPTDSTWLTEFEDRSAPRKGDDDLTFAAAGDQNPVQRPTRIVYAARTDGSARPAFALLGAAVGGLYLTRFLVGLASRRG
ncbi:MAG TPA: DUF2330 domain-containing protein [Gemmata sp.]